MADKVIAEIRFIETDDGFRIETKGDKEHLRKMGFGPGMRHWRRAYKSWMRGPGRGFRPPWMWGDWEEGHDHVEDDVSEETKEI